MGRLVDLGAALAAPVYLGGVGGATNATVTSSDGMTSVSASATVDSTATESASTSNRPDPDDETHMAAQTEDSAGAAQTEGAAGASGEASRVRFDAWVRLVVGVVVGGGWVASL